MKRTLGGVLFAILMAACSGDDIPGTRHKFAEEHFSVHVPDEWSTDRERGSVVFVGDSAHALDHATISIRSVARTRDWVVDRTPELVVPATARTLAALPGATVSDAKPLRVDSLVGAVFDLTYEPHAGDGKRYQRRHAVLVGKKRVFHIFHTAPDGELGKSADAFDIALKSLREEG